MTRYRYLIIGGGMAAASAAEGIRKHDDSGTIGLISLEPDPPYDRPPLSKKLWSGISLDSIWRRTRALRVHLQLARKVLAIDPESRTATDTYGDEYYYEKLLLATGTSPSHLTTNADEGIYFRTLEDYRTLRFSAHIGRRVAVIGGGLIGSELAASLAGVGCSVIMLFSGSHLCEPLFPTDLAEFVDRYYLEKGIELRPKRRITSVERRGPRYHIAAISVDDQIMPESFEADLVVAATGVVPNIRIALEAGLAVADGIVVNEQLQTSNPDIFAAGDVASFYSPALGRRLRFEHEDNANAMGLAAGEAMAGTPIVFTHLPFFSSDFFDLGYDAVGDVDSALETVSDWKEPYRSGIVYYLREKKTCRSIALEHQE